MERPASTIRGAATSPRAAASRMARVAPLPSPRLRTVVNPASSVLRALASVRRVTSGTLSVRSSISDALPPASESRWTWLSIRPGSTKRSERSISRAPAGGGVRPSRTSLIFPPATKIVEGPRGGRPGRSSRRPACMIVSCGGGAGAWAIAAVAEAASRQANKARRRIGPPEMKKLGASSAFGRPPQGPPGDSAQFVDLRLELGELRLQSGDLLLAAVAALLVGLRLGGARDPRRLLEHFHV